MIKLLQFRTPVLQLHCSTAHSPSFGVNLVTYVVFSAKP